MKIEKESVHGTNIARPMISIKPIRVSQTRREKVRATLMQIRIFVRLCAHQFRLLLVWLKAIWRE